MKCYFLQSIETSQWTSYEKRTLNELEIKETLQQAREEEVVEQVQSILKQPIMTLIEAQERLQAVQTRAATLYATAGSIASTEGIY